MPIMSKQYNNDVFKKFCILKSYLLMRQILQISDFFVKRNKWIQPGISFSSRSSIFQGRNDKRNKPKTMSLTVFVIFVEFDSIDIER